ncbi:MAG: hypothetical protein BWK73_20970 [Thiothrix lacustris]|uniref:Glycosyltransferase subfamily 4-like N-terminal domain-containing protein n=1 Tax=Thiothrix lacustris TaxID=525917 RepID=A0A1Y1QNP4_9GAMM|nr:MAG: hypothetical protein BWK73_20970 [Thiothrix lacustris]
MNATVILSAYYRHKPGGFTTRLYRAYRALDAAGYRVIYIATEQLPVAGERIQPVILPMRSHPLSRWYWPEFYWRAWGELRRLTREHGVQQHVMFSFFYASLSILAGWGLGVRTLTFIRGDDIFDAAKKRFSRPRRWVHGWLEKLGMRYSYQVITTSETMKAIINQRAGGQDKTQSLPNNIATQALPIQLPNIRQDTVRIATLSVLNPRKNQLLALQALQQLPAQNWEYLLIGSDNSGLDYQAELQAYVTAHGMAERVKFLGWRDDVPAILQHCHLLLLPTLHEGSPNALLEAMGYGLPCLASDIPEIREILPDQELLFYPHHPAELTRKLARFLQLPGYAGVIQAKTAQCSARYTFDWDQRLVALVDAAIDG